MKGKGKKLLLLLPILCVAIALLISFMPRSNDKQIIFKKKAEHLKANVVTDEIIKAIGDFPVDKLGHVVFFSVSDGITRAKVYSGTGKTLSDAWDNAVHNTLININNDSSEPRWLRVDVVSKVWPVTSSYLLREIDETTSGFDFNGIAFDPRFETALLEGELNGRHIYDYKEDNISINLLNVWLEDNERVPLQELPENLIEFSTCGWFCDESDNIFPLYHEGADTGRRQVVSIDNNYAKKVIDTASLFLLNQVKEDGSFIYGIHPQYDEEIENYNIVRHSGTIWSLICRYRMFPDETLKKRIEQTINYMLSQLLYDDSGAAYLYEAKDYEVKLGGNGIAVVALTEYMDVFHDDTYREYAIALGNGILKQQNPEDGSYWHILTNTLSRAEQFRTIYYDGECTFALARLYALTGEAKWLDAACRAVDHFIAKDYTQYRDHWVAYSLNEITKYVDRPEYYEFALSNATNNYSRIRGRYRTYPTNLELLISCFETWQRMMDKGIDVGDFEVQELLDVIVSRADRQLSGYFYPEIAMYMDNPQRILGSFMMRNDKFRVRIDDVQHNIGGFYLYWKNYDAMIAAGLNPNIISEATTGD